MTSRWRQLRFLVKRRQTCIGLSSGAGVAIGVGTAAEIGVRRTEVIAPVFAQRARDSVAVHQQMQVRNRFTQRHHHLPRIELTLEQHRQQIARERGCLAMLFDREHAVFVMVDQLPQPLAHAVERQVVRR
jgi:hypothetical protein